MADIMVIWDDNKIGSLFKDGVISCSVYTRQYAVYQAIGCYLTYLCRHPLSIQQIFANKINGGTVVSGPNWSSTDSCSFQLSMAYPRIGDGNKHYIIKIIHASIHDYLYKILKQDIVFSDLLFMAKIGSIRDWTKNCCICLLENMGDPHGWGGFHQRIIIFRPCGHSICERPCFNEFKSSHHTKCPICRTTIESSFCQQTPYCSDLMTDTIYTDVIETRHGKWALV